MYEYHNRNPLGLYEDDCVVRALSLATNNTWDDTYIHLCNQARIQGKMMNDRQFVIDYLDQRYQRIDSKNYNVGQISYNYSDNVLLITMLGHITCSKYGKIYDSFDCRNREVEYCWLIK